MSAREIHCYEYVNHPYEKVAGALRDDALGVFQRATVSAATRANALVATLRATIGPFEVGTDVAIQVKHVETDTTGPLAPVTRISLTWQATKSAALFPSMRAILSIYPLSAGETQLDLVGEYVPPLGIFGTAGDALVGHRIADATVHRFVEDIAERLKVELR